MLHLQKRLAQTAHFRVEGYPAIISDLLMARGVTSQAEAERFLHPDPSQLLDPMLMQNMSAIVARIRSAIEKHERICVYGDYDVDGVTASSILSTYLRSIGADVTVYIPSRHEEGYGLNVSALEKLTLEKDLIITVDCGISNKQEVAYVRGLGKEIIVTDHHDLPPELPDCLCLNPKMGNYPTPNLCGAGVATKLVHALGGVAALDKYYDLAALGTIADIVPLLGENRVLTALGLKAMRENMRPGLRALCRVAGLKCDANEHYAPTSGNISFQIAPRINAGGRLETALQCVQLLTTTDEALAESLAEHLDAENSERMELEESIIEEAEKQLEEADFSTFRCIIIVHEDWNPGVIGLAASKLTEKYHFPSIVFTCRDGMCTGSCRSIDGVDIHAALSSCSDLFERFGGHPKAAGLTLKEANMPEFTKRLNLWIRDNCDFSLFYPVEEYDLDAASEDLTIETAQLLDLFAPTGYGNPSPVLRMQADVVNASACGASGAHFRGALQSGDVRTSFIAFGYGKRAGELSGTRQDTLFALGINRFNGRESVQAEIKAFAPVSPNAQIKQLETIEGSALVTALDDMLFTENCDGSAEVTGITEQQMAALLRRDPLGVVLAGETAGVLRRTLIALAAQGVNPLPDVCAGYPCDRRMFDSLCLCPYGEPPVGCHYYVSLGNFLPENYVKYLSARGIRVLRLTAAVTDRQRKPDDDTLRAIYKYIRAESVRLSGLTAITDITDCIAGACRITAEQAVIALHIFRELGLLAFTKEAHAPKLIPGQKVSLTDSPTYRQLS